jgi:SAM domain (Sterile alpha motif)
MSEIHKWLKSIGLGQYSDALEINEIDVDLLGQVEHASGAMRHTGKGALGLQFLGAAASNWVWATAPRLTAPLGLVRARLFVFHLACNLLIFYCDELRCFLANRLIVNR